MLHSLEIKNYRNLRHLVIPKLGRVNLVIGKNNTGKSSLLEAVAIYIIFGSNNFFIRLINFQMIRGEIDFSSDLKIINEASNNPQIVFNKLNEIHFLSLFYNREIDKYLKDGKSIFISSNRGIFELNIVKSYFNENNEFKIASKKDEIPGLSFSTEVFAGLRVGKDIDYMALPISGNTNYGQRSEINKKLNNTCGFVSSSFNPLSESSDRIHWGAIVLTEKEKYVIDALKIVEPRIEQLSYAGDNLGKPYVRLKNESMPVPLRSMGDGINRVLKIILSMVVCENGTFIIDEFENGLHYSVQEKLWEIIFQLADKLNIQVFATTHSNDTIKSFESIVNSNESYKDSQLIKLINVDGDIKQETADAEDLEIIVDGNFDPR